MLNRVMKLKTNKLYSGWDWTCDGIFQKPRVKGKYKRQRSKYRRTVEKRFTQKEVDMHY